VNVNPDRNTPPERAKIVNDRKQPNAPPCESADGGNNALSPNAVPMVYTTIAEYQLMNHLQTGDKTMSTFAKTISRLGAVLVTVAFLTGCNSPNKDIQPISTSPVTSDDPDAEPVPVFAPPPRLPYTLVPGDEIHIGLIEEPNMDRQIKIDTDGGFQYPYVERVRAEGLTTLDLSRKMAQRLTEYYNDPHVTINLVSQEQQFVRILGMAYQPGLLPLKRDMTLIDAIAEAGGPRPEADLEKIVLIRRISEHEVIAGFFDYRDAMLNPMGGSWASNVPLQRGDTIYMPINYKSQWLNVFQFINSMFGAITDVERSIVLYPSVEDVFNFGRPQQNQTIIVR